MTHPSDRLFRGELNDTPAAALQAIVDEFNYEVSLSERSEFQDEHELEFATEFRKYAQEAEATRKFYVENWGSMSLSEMAEKIVADNMAGDMSETIAEALLTGDWTGCAI